MNILFISDFNLNHNSGGAQVSNDLIISSNLEVINQTSNYLLDYIINHPNHIRLEHDSCLYLE